MVGAQETIEELSKCNQEVRRSERHTVDKGDTEVDTDRISQSERSLGTATTQVQDDPSSRLTELEEDEEKQLKKVGGGVGAGVDH